MSKHWKTTVGLFLTGQLFSLFGSLMVQYAITWYITLTTQSGLMMTISILCGFIPAFILSPVAGVWADRFNRKRIIIIADGMIAMVTLLTAITFLLGYREIWLLFVVSIFRSFGSAVHSPAVSAVYPQIVPSDQLVRVQGINSGIQSSMMIVAPIIALGLLSIWPLEWVFSIDVITAILAIVTLTYFVKLPKHANESSGQKVEYFKDIKMGLQYIKEHQFLIPFFIYTAFILFMVAPVAFLTPLQVVRTYGSDLWRLSAIEIAFSVGMTLGGFGVGIIGGFKNRIVTMSFAMVLMGLSSAILGLQIAFWLYLGVMGFIGLMLPFYNTPAIVMIQEKVEPSYLGRVLSVMSMISTIAMPLGMIVFGPLADMIDVEWILIGTGLMMVFFSITMSRNKRLLEAGVAKIVSTDSPVNEYKDIT
jgi:MFS transporter, DHA3 family, macrolide efflux protein